MKRRTRLVLLSVGTVVIVLTVGIAAVVYGLLSDMCGNDTLAEFASPDAEARLVVFQRDCGATTGFSTQATLLGPNTHLPNKSGNVFIADTNHGIAPAGNGGGPEVRVQWLGSKLLLLQHHGKARVFKAEQRLGGVEVRYETFR